MIKFVKLKMVENGKSALFNANTIKKDVGVLLQNYLLPNKPQSNEDYSSLLIDLDLIRQNSEDRNYYFKLVTLLYQFIAINQTAILFYK